MMSKRLKGIKRRNWSVSRILELKTWILNVFSFIIKAVSLFLSMCMCSGSCHLYWLSLQLSLNTDPLYVLWVYPEVRVEWGVLTNWQRKCRNQKIPASVDIDGLMWTVKDKNDSRGSDKATARERKAQLSRLPPILGTASDHPLRISLEETASAAVA